MEFNSDAIGGRLMESITSGLYGNNVNCLREYIQNSIDSGAKNIDVSFENGTDLIIHDDGSGMSEEKLEKSLRVGISDKTKEDVGWRGIGIWSGVPVCKRIVIITKERNNDKLRLEINNDELRKGMNGNKPLLEVLKSAIGDIEHKQLGKDELSENDNFTIVRLESILQQHKRMFNEDEICDYLARAVPVPFNEEQFSFATEINEWLSEKGVKYPLVNITYQKDKHIFRHLLKNDTYHNHLVKKEFKMNDKLIAVLWSLQGNANKKLHPPDGGIYFKKKGFTIGNERLPLKLYSGTYSQWQYGEIHIISNDVKENSARDDFEYDNDDKYSFDTYSFMENVGKYIGEFRKLDQYQSKIKRVHKDLVNLQKSFADGTITKLKKDKLESEIEDKKPAFPLESSFQGLQQLIDNKLNQIDITPISIAKKSPVKSNEVKTEKEQFDELVETLPSELQSSLKRMTKTGQLHPEISVTDAIRDLLKQKTGLNINEMIELSKDAYGWDAVSFKEGQNPVLTIVPNLKGNKKSREAKRNRHLGVMIYIVHDLFVNMYKHERGTDSARWFEDASVEEKYAIRKEMYAVIGLIYRLIEKSEKYQP